MLDEALLVNELHECVKQVALNLILKQRLIHVFHEIGLLAARIHGLDEGGVARRQRRVDHALVHFVRFPMLWPVAWVAEFRQLLLRIDVAAHFARAAHSLTVGTLRPLLLLFRCLIILRLFPPFPRRHHHRTSRRTISTNSTLPRYLKQKHHE